MKNLYKKLVILSLSLFLVTSCDNILEPEFYNQIDTNDFPKTESDILSSFIPFYAQFNPNYGNLDSTIPNGGYDWSFTASYLGYTWATSIQTDESFDFYASPYSQYRLAPSTYLNDLPNSFAFYRRISHVAKISDIIDRINNSSINNKDKYVAEAKVLRALYMYILYDLYGPVSVKLDPAILTDDSILPRPSRADYVNIIINDLEDAIADLPEKYNNTQNWGRMSKGVASMLLLKVYMHEKNWSEAKIVAESITTMGYSLQPSYKNVFIQQQNNEVIFATPGNDATENIWYACILPPSAKIVLGNNVTAGAKYQLYDMPWSFYDKYTTGDTRLETIANQYTNNSNTVISRNNGLSGAIPMKYTNYVANSFGFDYVIYRYSDVLLSLAEINNELDGPTDIAKGYLNQVTNRANTTASIPTSVYVSKESLRQFILDERGRELYLEFGIRRQDLIRNESLISNALSRGKSDAADYKTLFPIPADVIIESGGIITQNPGY